MKLTRGNLNFHSQAVNISFEVTHRFDDVIWHQLVTHSEDVNGTFLRAPFYLLRTLVPWSNRI